MDKTKLQPLKGFRDFYPEEMTFQNWFYQNIKEVSESYGFQEYEGPTVEPLDLYAAKSGEELVKKQAFTWKDKAGKILALRPEMTPTLARMVAQKEMTLNLPVKWFTYGRRFRYEQPQKGRGREFFQWDIDILGPENPEADAELITIAATFYQKLGLNPNEVKIRINDRKFLEEKLTGVGITQNKIVALFKVIDKKDKIEEKVFNEMLSQEVGSNEKVEKIINILSDKNAYQKSDWLKRIFDYIEKAGLSAFIEFDPSVVRGLDYYTRTVFEGWDVKGGFRAIWGGGRYDNLTADVGAKTKIPGVGFAMGDMIIEEILKACNKYPLFELNKTKVLVTVFSPDLYSPALLLSRSIRESGINTELYPDPEEKLDKQLKYADKKGVPWIIIVGPEELKNNNLVLKNMQTTEQTTAAFDEVVARIKSS